MHVVVKNNHYLIASVLSQNNATIVLKQPSSWGVSKTKTQKRRPKIETKL